MLKHETTYKEPRQQSIIDLKAFIAERITRTEEIILSIDANETIDTKTPSKPNSTQSLIENLGLINLTTEKFIHHKTHKGGRCIDYCAITPNLQPAIQSFGYFLYNRITTTDHCLYFLDLEIQTLFTQTPDNPVNYSSRLLKSSIPKRKQKYIEEVEKNFAKQYILKAALNLQSEATKKKFGTLIYNKNMIT